MPTICIFSTMGVTTNPRIQLSIIMSWVSFVLFVIFYLIAALNYSGGSYANPDQAAFSFPDNYLCDLLDEHAINGSVNSAKMFARIALGCLCLGIFLFWNHLPKLFRNKSGILKIMQISGMLSMLTTVFLATGNHDLVTRIAGLIGAFAMCLAFIFLYRAGFRGYVFYGILCLILILLNYYSYETGVMRHILPLFQKVTTIACLGWFVLLNLELYKHVKIH